MSKRKFVSVIISVALILGIFLFHLWALILSSSKVEKYIHLSFDDAITLFEDLTANENTYNSIFDQPLLGYLKQAHEKTGLTVSFYCFYTSNGFDLSQATDKFSEEFIENADWLKFGFHDIDGISNLLLADRTKAQFDYNTVVTQLLRITGSEACLDVVPRLQNFAGSQEGVTGMMFYNMDHGIYGLLAADDTRNSYYLTQEQSAELLSTDWIKDSKTGVVFITTDLRLENTENPYEDLVSISKDSQRSQVLEIFTHEWIVDDSIKDKIDEVLRFADDYGYTWSFAQDVLI